MIRNVAILVVFVQSMLVAYSAAVNSIVWDELGHLPAGLSHWRFGNFNLYPVNPPLVRSVAAVPLLFTQIETDWSEFDTGPGLRAEGEVGRDLLAANPGIASWYLMLARWACIPFSLLGAVICYRWARELYAPASGLVALTLWCVCPNVLGHGALITPDVGAAAMGLAAMYLFWRWLKDPSWRRAVAAGLVLGLAELTKTTWVILFALWPALLACSRPSRRQYLQLAVMMALAIYLINLGYLFERSCTRLGDFKFISPTLAPHKPNGFSGNRFQDTWSASIPVPLPYNYVAGIDVQKFDFDRKMWSYLRGEWKLGGWWHYYIYAAFIKVPLGTMLLLGLAVYSTCRGNRAGWRDELVLLAPAIVVFAFVSSQTGFNHHLRYVLPAFPFFFVWASKVARSSRWLKRLSIAALAWSAASSLSHHPHGLSYFNESVGGPQNGHWHLGASNVDWGQDLKRIETWYAEHPEARPLHLAYDLPLIDLDPKYKEVPPGPVMNRPGTPKTHNWPWGDVARDPKLPFTSSSGDSPPGPLPGWFAISANQIHRLVGDYEYFMEFEPIDSVGSTFIYHITLDETNRVRRKLGLPELTQ